MPRVLLYVALLVQLAWGMAFIATSAFSIDGITYFSLFDDAMISMRYARNLADGAGLVWNPGEAPVEGYTNLLWTLWMAVLHTVAAGPTVSLLVMLTGLAALLGNIVVIWALAREVEPREPVVAGIAAVLVACCYSLGYWTLRGMETGVFVLVLDTAVLASVARTGTRRWPTPVLVGALAMLPLIRADGIVPAAAIGIYAAATEKRRRAAPWILPAIPLAVFVAHALLRHNYYGEWLPNTYYLKMEGVSILTRVARGLPALALTWAWALWPASAVMALGRPFDRSRRLPALLIAVACAYSIYVGGDAWEWTGHINRYVVCALPLAFIVAAAGIHRLATALPSSDTWPRWLPAALFLGLGAHIAAATLFFPEQELAVWRKVLFGMLAIASLALAALKRPSCSGRFQPVVAPLACGIVLLTLSGPKVAEWIRYGDFHVIDDGFLAEMGVRLRPLVTPDTRIAVVTAGAIPYFAHALAVDLLGKSDRYIAHLPSREPFLPGHSKWDYRYSVDTWQPDVIIQLWRPTPEDIAALRARNYRANDAGVFVRVDSTRIDTQSVLERTLAIERRRAAARQH